MIDINRLRKYFIYSEISKTVISVTSGIFIGMFNLFSGIIIFYTLTQLIFFYYTPDILNILLLLIPGILAGACLLKLCITFMDIMLTGIEVDNYTYVRLILLASVSLYLLILILFFSL